MARLYNVMFSMILISIWDTQSRRSRSSRHTMYLRVSFYIDVDFYDETSIPINE